GHLPVAVRIVAGRLQANPQWTIRRLLKRLTAAQARLDAFEADDLTVRSGFELSYRDLGKPAAQLFGMAAAIPGGTFSLTAAAATRPGDHDRDLTAVEEILDRLVEENLLQAAGTRYRYHDLLRLFAMERLEAAEGEAGPATALHRLGARYLAGTAAAMRLL